MSGMAGWIKTGYIQVLRLLFILFGLGFLRVLCASVVNGFSIAKREFSIICLNCST